MGLFDDDNSNGIFNSNNGQTPSGFAPAPTTTTTTTTADASPEADSAYDFFSNLNPAQQLMAVKTGLVTNLSGSTQDPPQADSGNASTVSGPTSPGSEPAQGNPQNTHQRTTSAEPSYGGSYSGERESPWGNSKQSDSYSRKLTDLEKYYFRGAGYEDDLLDNMTIHSGKSHPLLVRDGITPNANEIYMRAGKDKPDSMESEDLKFLTHELHHAQQYREGMTKAKYVNASTKYGYDKNPYEVEADERAAQAFERIKALRIQEIRREAGANPDGTYSR